MFDSFGLLQRMETRWLATLVKYNPSFARQPAALMSIINELEIQDLDSSPDRGIRGESGTRGSDDTGEDIFLAQMLC